MDELTIAFKIESPPSWLPIGRTAENNWRTVEIDCSYWFNMNANGEVVLMYKPSCGMSPYPLLTERDGDNIIWRPKSGELVEGVGRLQAFFEVGTDVIGSSDMISCEVDSSLLGADPGTDPGQTDLPWALDIIEQIAELSGHYPKIENGVLYVWDSEQEDWVQFQGGGGNPDAVLYTPMNLTPAQKEQARENIGAAGADDVDELSSVVTGQSKTSTVEEVENSKAFAAGKINYSASKGNKITVNVSGSAFSGSSATLYFWYAGASSHTSVGTITLGTDTDYTLSNDITAVEVYSATGGAGTVRFEIVKTSGTSGGLVGAVSALNSSVSDLSDVIGVGGTSTTVTHGGGNLTVNLDFSAESGETIGITPSGAALTGTTCFLYFRYVGDSGNTQIGAISVGEETRITLERAIQRVSIYASGAAAGDASLAVRTVGIKDNVDDLVASANPLKGKKLNFLGDSITYGSGASHPFTYYLEQKYGCTCRNYGIAGSTVQYDENRNPMCVRYADMDDDADIVAVMGGTNDYWNNKPLGEMGDTVNTTFYGALDIMISGLIAKYPSALIYMVTPPHGDNGGNFDGSAKSNSGSMQDIANAVCEVASKYSIPVLDVFNAGGLYPSITDQKDIYYSDGVHLNAEGQKKLAQMHASFILSGGIHSGKAHRYDYATETWVEGKGYQTAAQVQTAIAAIPDELPAVSASDNGKFLRVVSGAWAAETIQTYQGGSY